MAFLHDKTSPIVHVPSPTVILAIRAAMLAGDQGNGVLARSGSDLAVAVAGVAELPAAPGGILTLNDAAITYSTTDFAHIAVVRDAAARKYRLYTEDPAAPGTTVLREELTGADLTGVISSIRMVSQDSDDEDVDEWRVSNVARYSGASFATPTSAFTPDANTLSLNHFDGVNGAGIPADEIVGTTWGNVGCVLSDTTPAPQFGSNALHIGVSGFEFTNILGVPLLATDSWTWEFWFSAAGGGGGFTCTSNPGDLGPLSGVFPFQNDLLVEVDTVAAAGVPSVPAFDGYDQEIVETALAADAAFYKRPVHKMVRPNGEIFYVGTPA